MNKRLQNQFGLEQDQLAELLGDQVIEMWPWWGAIRS
jgi:hypothetical protein